MRFSFDLYERLAAFEHQFVVDCIHTFDAFGNRGGSVAGGSRGGWAVKGDIAIFGVDINDDALALAAENKARLHAENVTLRRSDLFAGLAGEVYDLIVTNPPYVTHAETDALPKEYSHEPEMGLRAGDDGLDLVLEILRDAPDHLSENGLLICEVGESEQHLIRLLPELPFAWVEFKVGQMGIFVLEREDIVAQMPKIKSLANARRASRH